MRVRPAFSAWVVLLLLCLGSSAALAEPKISAKWEQKKNGSWKLGVTVSDPKLAGTRGVFYMGYGKNPRRTLPPRKKYIDSDTITVWFRPVKKIKTAFGEWTVYAELWRINKKTKKDERIFFGTLGVPLGTGADLAKFKKTEEAWLVQHLVKLLEAQKRITDGDPDAKLESIEELRELQKKTNPELDWQRTSEWHKKIQAWYKAHAEVLGRLQQAHLAHYGSDETNWGRVYSESKELSATLTRLIGQVAYDYKRDFGWDDVPRYIRLFEEREGAEREKLKAAGLEEEEIEKEMEAWKAQVPRLTYESVMERRQLQLKNGNLSFDFEGRRRDMEKKITGTRLRVNIQIGRVPDLSLGAFWEQIQRLLELAESMAKGHDELIGKPMKPFAKKPWMEGPGSWKKSLEEIEAKLQKWTDRAADPNNALKGRADVLAHVLAARKQLAQLRLLYLKELYEAFPVPEASQEPMGEQPEGTTIEKTLEALKEQTDAIEAFFEAERADRAKGLQEVRDTLSRLTEEIKEKFVAEDADANFDEKTRDVWLRPWEDALIGTYRQRKTRFAYKDTPLFYPKSRGILLSMQDKLERMRSQILAVHTVIGPEDAPAPKDKGKALIDKEKTKAAVDILYKQFQTALGQMDKELQRKSIKAFGAGLQ